MYYHMLQRNYQHDSIMAQHVDYYVKYAALITKQITDTPEILRFQQIRQSISYLAEDLGDAGGDASKAASALGSVVEALGESDSD